MNGGWIRSWSASDGTTPAVAMALGLGQRFAAPLERSPCNTLQGKHYLMGTRRVRANAL